MTNELIIRSATVDDAFAISSLVKSTAASQLRSEFTEGGWELFLRLLSEKTQRGTLQNQQFEYLLAVSKDDQSQIIGVLAIKDKTHLFHFFIATDWQRQGIGEKLWQQFLKNTDLAAINKITVNASDFAIGFYQKLGFVIEQPRQIKNGVCFTAMSFNLSRLHND